MLATTPASHDLAVAFVEALAAVAIALLDGLVLQWLLDPAAPPGGREIAAALRAVATPAPAPPPGGSSPRRRPPASS